MKFHTDEHVAEALAVALRRRGFDVTTTPQAKLLGANDSEQLAYCLRQKRVIITHDADMLRLSSSGIKHFGIAYCHPSKYKVGGLLRQLLLLSQNISEKKMRGRINYL